ncbi:metal ABC transporter substrate-binding protein [Microbacterium koreense]|uniref:Metal ABC transporter substrate-binding protein n=1 Tax=Microbacterium koreense TaxID=323761 RepID=A0ABW2ZMW2_9MICO
MRRAAGSVTALLAAGLVLAGCSSSTEPGDDSSDGAFVVATTTMLGSVVGDIVACAGGNAETLMPAGADPHDFSASSAQIASMASADLVVTNGFDLEEGLTDAIDSAASDGATVLGVAPEVHPIEFGAGGHEDEHDHSEEDAHNHEDEHAEDEHDHDHAHAHDHGSMDPHFWHDAARMAEAAELIGAELGEVTGDDAYVACGTEVHDTLLETDAQVREILSAVPAERRVLITDHDAFGYFADAYDFEVVGTVIPSGSTLAEPSSAELTALVETVNTTGVPAIFSNNANPTDLVDAVAEEAGTDVEVVELFVGSLGEAGSGADTYTGMVTTNAQRIADALG